MIGCCASATSIVLVSKVVIVIFFGLRVVYNLLNLLV